CRIRLLKVPRTEMRFHEFDEFERLVEAAAAIEGNTYLIYRTRHQAVSVTRRRGIARILNMKQLLTPRGLPWTMDRVQRFRAHHGIRKPKQTTAQDVLTGQQARQYLGIGYNGLLALIRRGVVHTHQVTNFAPWRIPRAELDSKEVQKLVRILKKTGRCPAGRGSPDSQESLFKPEKPSILQKEAL
ncbi:MAG: hypothetical protein ACYS0K_24995, partial [Planctomycetota bacterium]